MLTLQRVEQEAVSSQNMANAIENLSKTRSVVTGSRLRLKDGERLHPRSWSGNAPLGGLVREVAAWLGNDDPKHEAGKLVQRITKVTLRATEALTDGRYAEDDKYVELDCELCDRRRSKSHRPEGHSNGAESWVRGMASTGYAPKSSNDLAKQRYNPDLQRLRNAKMRRN